MNVISNLISLYFQSHPLFSAAHGAYHKRFAVRIDYKLFHSQTVITTGANYLVQPRRYMRHVQRTAHL